ncbi:MAG TPA: TMEM175 family protein [Mucilaginibacter sp.]|jgi:uncharacterized membrane protein
MSSENKKKKTEMMSNESTPERIYAFSDGVFAIIITIMVLELKKPAAASFSALFQLWPTWISYGVSYLFIAIVWINHHYLLSYARSTRLRLMWANFSHLFSVSLIPFLTDWMADTRLQSVPVAMYAFVFLLVNATYLWLAWETLYNCMTPAISKKAQRLLNLRSFITMSIFIGAMIIAMWSPFLAFGLIICCLLLYLRPELPEVMAVKE